MSHSREPWRVAPLKHGSHEILDADGGPVAQLWKVGNRDRHEIDARRVVACVNACAGIPTETLESGKTWTDAMQWSGADILWQRDELLAALEGLYAHTKANHNICSLNENARAAITRVKGGA